MIAFLVLVTMCAFAFAVGYAIGYAQRPPTIPSAMNCEVCSRSFPIDFSVPEADRGRCPMHRGGGRAA